MKILSLFDGISCARVALDKLGIPVELYRASEVDAYAMQISQKNWPDIQQIGGVETVRGGYGHIDLLIGGSPCQDLSIAKNGRTGLLGERSKLFWEYVRVLKEAKPKYFVLENVASMSAEAKAQMTEIMGVEPIMINAATVSGQQRKRLFWTNIPNITQPEDRGIFLKDIIEDGFVNRDKSVCIDANYFKGGSLQNYLDKKRRAVSVRQSENRLMVTIRAGQIYEGKGQAGRVYDVIGKSVALSANGGGVGAKTGLYLIAVPKGDTTITKLVDSEGNEYIVRKLTPLECERLQGVPDGYTEGISNSQRYKTLGNAFNADVIAHILSFMPEVAK